MCPFHSTRYYSIKRSDGAGFVCHSKNSPLIIYHFPPQVSWSQVCRLGVIPGLFDALFVPIIYNI